MKYYKRFLYRGDVYMALENERLKALPNVLNSEYMNGVHDGLKKAQQLITELEDALYFYAPAYCESEWHESQRFICEVGGVRFFEEAG